MKRYIKTAKEPAASAEDIFSENLDKLKDDFAFAISGIEKLAADGDLDRATELVNTTSAMINGAIEDIAEDIAAED